MSLKNAKVSVRLLGGFAAILLCLIAVGVVGDIGVTIVSDEAIEAVTVKGRILEHAARAKSSLVNMRRYEKDAFINYANSEKVGEYIKKWETERDDFLKCIQILKDTDKAGIYKDKLNTVASEYETYAKAFGEVGSSVKSGSVTSTQDANSKIASVKEATHKIEATMKEIAEVSSKAMAEEASHMVPIRHKVMLVLIVLTLVAVIVGVVAASVITKSITSQLGGEPHEVAETIGRIANGDLSTRVTLHPGDSSSLMFSMKEMSEHLRGVIGQIKTVSNSLASASNQLSSSSEEISSTTTDQSSRSTQIATSAEELTQTVMDVARNASGIAESAQSTVAKATEGDNIVENSVREIKEISVAINSTSSVMESLHDRSKQIGEIIKVINDIADQTNLLALNAAIEAARAGEQGRGFAVVADEVRKLAERTGRATSEIGGMIASIQREVDESVGSMKSAIVKVDNGVELSTRAGRQLKEIVGSIHDLQGLVQQIASATEEMSSVAETIGSDISTIADSSREVSSGTVQIAESSADLSRMAETLRSTMDTFKL